ncbi:MAG: cytochrome C assembly family protein, partial [Myxococcota bacterium]
MVVTSLLVATASLYALACALYLAFLVRGREGLGHWGNRVLAAAGALHLAYVGMDWTVRGNLPFQDIHGTLSILSVLVVLGFLVATLRYRVSVLGAFITPITLLLLLGAGVSRGVAEVPPEVRSFLLPLHIALNVLGLVAFALAFGAAVAYVLQERQLRRKKLGGLFQRLPALDVLDSFGFRLVVIGFPLLTLGIVTGTVWAVRLDPGAPAITAAQGFALLAWIVFGGVLLLRVAAGWRGRRAAIGTIMGFLCTMAVLV